MSPKLPRVTASEALRALMHDGWYRDHQTGAHLYLLHPTKSGRVTLPMHSSRTLRLGTIASILEEAGLSVDEFRRLL
ncbi:MAG: type II toxin-antitoxin system HicA family toxin [Chloroflexi bacterium]|nr:type II toxin-antitoxin system HicA family toxin [Chloroflexota bacterium]